MKRTDEQVNTFYLCKDHIYSKHYFEVYNFRAGGPLCYTAESAFPWENVSVLFFVLIAAAESKVV